MNTSNTMDTIDKKVMEKNSPVEFTNDYECKDCEFFFSGVGLTKEAAACIICFEMIEPYYTEATPI